MKKLFLYVSLLLMYCDIAYATFLESLVVGLIITIINLGALSFTNSFIPVYIIYGIGIIWTVLFWGSVLSNSKKKERKQNIDTNLPDSIGVWVVPILFLVFFLSNFGFHSVPFNRSELLSVPFNAKYKETKNSYGEMATYIAVEMMSCSMDETTTWRKVGDKVMSGNLTCHGRTADSVVAAAVIAKDDVMNAYETDKQAVTSGGTNTSDSDVGYIRLSVSGENIIIKTCDTKPCVTNANQHSKTIALQ